MSQQNESQFWAPEPDQRQMGAKGEPVTVMGGGMRRGSRPSRSFWPRRVILLVATVLVGAGIGGACAYFTRSFSAAVQLFAYERTFASQAEAADFVASTTSTGSIAKLVARLPKSVSTENLSDRCRVSVDQGQPYIGVSVLAESLASARSLVDAFATHVAACAEE